MNFEELKLQWLALEPWKRFGIVLTFAGIIVYLIYMFKLDPILTEKDNLTKEIRQLKTEISILKARANPRKIAELEKEIKEVQKDIKKRKFELKKLKTIVPDKAEVDKILKSITINVYKSNLILNKFDISNENTVYLSYDKKNNKIIMNAKKNEKNTILLKRLTITLKITGSFKNLLKYIKALSKLKRLVIIDSISMRSVKDTLKIDMSISTFYSQETAK